MMRIKKKIKIKIAHIQHIYVNKTNVRKIIKMTIRMKKNG